MTKTWQCLAPLKLNLSLRIIARRSDGYHDLQSLMVCAGAGDLLTLTRDESAPHQCTLTAMGAYQNALPQNPQDNLILKAAHQFFACHEKPRGRFEFHLIKNLPPGAGLGGGSSDAAAALKLLAASLDAPLHPKKLALHTIGADIPFCLHGAPAWTEGIGERITPVKTMPQGYFLVVYPDAPLQTPAIFSQVQNLSPPQSLPANLLLWLKKNERNDLEPIACQECPAIATLLTLLRQNPHCLFARMSGSGSACFGFFTNEEDALTAAHAIKTAHPTWWHAVAPLLATVPQPNWVWSPSNLFLKC